MDLFHKWKKSQSLQHRIFFRLSGWPHGLQCFQCLDQEQRFPKWTEQQLGEYHLYQLLIPCLFLLLVDKREENPKMEPKARVVAPAANSFRKSRRETGLSNVTFLTVHIQVLINYDFIANLTKFTHTIAY